MVADLFNGSLHFFASWPFCGGILLLAQTESLAVSLRDELPALAGKSTRTAHERIETSAQGLGENNAFTVSSCGVRERGLSKRTV